MNSDQNYPSSRIPRPIETAATAIGIALFVVFAFVGISQAGDRQAVTGNKQEKQSAYSDIETALDASNALISSASVKTTSVQNYGANTEQPANDKKVNGRVVSQNSNDKADAHKSVRQDAIEKRAKVE